MAKTGIYVSLSDSQIGNNQSDESIAMIFADAPAISSTFLQDKAYMITGLQDAAALGITQEWETGQLDTSKSRLYTHIADFYANAGSGTKLWICGTTFTYGASGSLSQASFYSGKVADAVMQTVENGYALRPRIFILCKGEKAAASTKYTGDALNCDYDLTDIAAFQTFLEDMSNDNSIRMCGIYDGAFLNPATTPIDVTKLTDASGINAPLVGYNITDIHGYGISSTGHVGGILSGRNIQASIGNVSLGSTVQKAYFTNVKNTTGSITYQSGTPVSQLNNAKNDIIGEKGYVFLRTRPMITGLFYNDGSTCNLSTNALSKLEMVRVGNAVCDDAQQFLTLYLNVNIPVESDGTILASYKSSMSSDFYSRYIQPRLNAGQASDIRVTFSEKDGNYVQSKAIQCTVEILPSPAMEQGYVNVFYVSSL
jgi:hypothetical protein